jgi:hypothetical protein
MLPGGIVGGIGIVFGILFAASLPLWCTIVSSAGVVPFGMVGGFLARQRPGMKLNISSQQMLNTASPPEI